MSVEDHLALAFSIGSAAAAERFRAPDLARAAALLVVAHAWRNFRRDAGVGAVGPDHQSTRDADDVQSTQDPRRDAVVLFLADHAVSAIADAARTIAIMVDAKRRFAAPERAILDAARDAVAQAQDRAIGPVARALGLSVLEGKHPLAVMLPVIAAIERLAGDFNFVEAHGHDGDLRLPGGTLRRYVPAEPAGTWALNLALLARPPRGLPALPGIVPRGVFRLDLDTAERGTMLIRQWTDAADQSLRDQKALASRLQHGRNALAGLSRNARAGDAWSLIAALGAISRSQIVRALGLSRAGGDIQARALAFAGLVTLEKGGVVRPTMPGEPAAPAPPLDPEPLSAAVAALDESMAAIDRWLDRTGQVET